MTYASKQDLVDRFGLPLLVDLTDREEQPTGEANDTVIARALADADALINSYLAKRYTTPISPVPDQVKTLAIALARFNLYQDNPPEHVRKGYTDSVAFLKDVAAGNASLGDGIVATAPASGGLAQFDAPGRTFTRDSLKGF